MKKILILLVWFKELLLSLFHKLKKKFRKLIMFQLKIEEIRKVAVSIFIPVISIPLFKFCDFKNVSPQKKTVRSQKLFFQIVKLSEFILFASPSYPLDKFLSFIIKSY